MYTDTLLQVSDVKALRGQPAAQEQKCRFWVRPDGQMCVQHLRPPNRSPTSRTPIRNTIW